MEMSSQDDGTDPRVPDASSMDDALQREVDQALGGMSVEELMDEGAAAPGSGEALPEGVRKGKVIAIQGEDIFVDFGSKTQGILPAIQFADEDMPAVGDTVEVTIERYDPEDGLLVLSREGAVTAATWDTLEVGQVVEAYVTGSNTGGLELKFNNIRGFMPVSHIDLARTEDMKPYIQTKILCEVLEIDRRRESVTLSRRAMLKRQEEEAKAELLATLAEGQVVDGTVRTIMPYGAFVNLGGVDGLLHIGDMAHRRVEDPREIVTEGQHVKVMVLKIDRENDRIGLGLKQALPDPWEGAEGKWPVDELVTGRITRLADFGAFVELEEGVEGLIPISEMSFERRIKHPGDVLSEGDTVQLRVLNVEPDRKRISLSLKRVGEDPWTGAAVRWAPDTVVEGIVTKLADFGAFVELAPGVEGLVHISELAEGHVRSVSEVVREGDSVQAKVLDVDEDRRRIGLSIKALKQDPDYTGDLESAMPESEPRKKRKRPLKGGLDSGPDWLDLLNS